MAFSSSHGLRRLLPVAAALAVTLPGGATSAAGQASDRAVVLVSGVASITPFTTPDRACRQGLSAGNTWAFLRDDLTRRGFRVYTAPVMDTPGQPVPASITDSGRGPFGDCPAQLPLGLTVTSVEATDIGGRRLAAFLMELHRSHGVRQVDLVAHSLGGIFSRQALRELRNARSPLKLRSFTTLGSPWEPVMLAQPPGPSPDDATAACDGFQLCEAIRAELFKVPTLQPIIDSFQPALFRPWSAAQAGVLDGIPVTLVAGTLFSKPGGKPAKWPNDGFVQESAALARTVPKAVLPQRVCLRFPFAHSAYTARLANAPEGNAITWNAAVGNVVAHAIGTAGTPQQLPDGFGCPPVPLR
ncbi:MAG: esterase/lipase family protein [Cyanobacteriota bacterium]|jgi:pimeloyl-ACP methyl ester carboxylesterase